MIDILLVLILLYLICSYKVSSYTNYVKYNKSFQNVQINCPENYSYNYNLLRENHKVTQPYGYTKNEYIDKTRFIETSEPLPTNPDFFI